MSGAMGLPDANVRENGQYVYVGSSDGNMQERHVYRLRKVC